MRSSRARVRKRRPAARRRTSVVVRRRASAAVRRAASVAGVPNPTGPFALSVACGDLVFISGIRGIDPSTGAPAASDEHRVRLIFAHLGKILAEHGSTAQDVLSTRVYVTQMARHRPLINEAFVRFFGEALPARTIVEVRALNQDDTIEVEAISHCPLPR